MYKYSLSSLSILLRVPNVCSLHSPIQISAKRNKRPSGGVWRTRHYTVHRRRGRELSISVRLNFDYGQIITTTKNLKYQFVCWNSIYLRSLIIFLKLVYRYKSSFLLFFSFSIVLNRLRKILNPCEFYCWSIIVIIFYDFFKIIF